MLTNRQLVDAWEEDHDRFHKKIKVRTLVKVWQLRPPLQLQITQMLLPACDKTNLVSMSNLTKAVLLNSLEVRVVALENSAATKEAIRSSKTRVNQITAEVDLKSIKVGPWTSEVTR